MTESFRVVRDTEGNMSVEPGIFLPVPELVVAVNHRGEYSVVFNDSDRWDDADVLAGTLYAIADDILGRDGVLDDSESMPDVRTDSETDSES